ncbi:hypothetical protein [Geodermatophilus sp. URMC 63]
MPHFHGGEITHAQATLNAKEYAAAQLQAVATMTERYEEKSGQS